MRFLDKLSHGLAIAAFGALGCFTAGKGLDGDGPLAWFMVLFGDLLLFISVILFVALVEDIDG
jgi:hypothetical protein